MIIVYESKTGHTMRYADILSEKTGLQAYSTDEFIKSGAKDDIIFLGWMKAGAIQGLKKLSGYSVKAVCGSGTGRNAEPDEATVIERNNIAGTQFFYIRGGCKPLKEQKGMDKLMLAMFVKMLKKREQDEKTIEAISIIENGYDGVKEENLLPVLEWLKSAK